MGKAELLLIPFVKIIKILKYKMLENTHIILKILCKDIQMLKKTILYLSNLLYGYVYIS
jgi:hypothetical protein